MGRKIGVIGSTGRVGSELIKRENCFPIKCDLFDLSSIREGIKEVNPDVVINCAGYTKVDDAEKTENIVTAYQLNAFAPKSILECWRGRFLHLSTDYIFNGTKTGGYAENDIPDPNSTYSFSKMFGEVAIRNHSDLCIVRTTVLYEANGKKDNFVKTVYKRLKNKELVQVPRIYGSPTYIPHLADGLLFLANNNQQGVVNVAGSDVVTRLELAKRVARIFGFDESFCVGGNAYGAAKRGECYGLKIDKAKKIGVPIYSLQQGLEQFKKDLIIDAS